MSGLERRLFRGALARIAAPLLLVAGAAAACSGGEIVSQGERATHVSVLPTPVKARTAATAEAQVPDGAASAHLPGPAPARSVDVTPVATAAALAIDSWSPTGRSVTFIAYSAQAVQEADAMGGFLGFVQGSFGIHDRETGRTCLDFRVSTLGHHEGPAAVKHQWLADGRLLAATLDDRVHLIGPSCADVEDVTERLPVVPGHFGGTSPDGRLMVLGQGGWWLIQLDGLNGIRLQGVAGHVDDWLAWSPDGSHVVVTVSVLGQDDGGPSGTRISGTRIFDGATGRLVAAHDWLGAAAIGGVLGAAVWLGDDRVLVPITLDQGPLFLGLDGTVSSALEPFGASPPPAAPSGSGHAAGFAEVAGHYDRASGAVHLLLSLPYDPRSGAGERLALFHGESGLLEELDSEPLADGARPWLTDDGHVRIADADAPGGIVQRPLDPPGSPFAAAPASCGPEHATQRLRARWWDGTGLQIVTRDCEVVERLRLEPPVRSHGPPAVVSPDDRWVAVVTRAAAGGAHSGLFLVPLDDAHR